MHRLVPILALLALGVLSCERKQQPAPVAPAEASKQQPLEDEDGYVFGFVGSLTGPEASFGTPVRDGILFALEEANAAGGVRGRKVELRAYDSQGRPEEAASAAMRLVSKDYVVILLG